MIWQFKDLFANEVVPFIANAGIESPVVRGVFGAGHASTVDADKAILAEAAAFIEVLIEAASWMDNGLAGLFGLVINLALRAHTASAIDEIVTKSAYAGLLGVRIDLVGIADDKNARSIDAGIAWAAAASIILWEVSLVDWATLADILDDLKARLALADAVDKHLIGSACVDAVAPLCYWIVRVPFWTYSAPAVNAVVIT